MADIRKPLAPDYLRRGSGKKEPPAAPAEEALPPFLSDALLACDRPMIEALRRAAPGTVRLQARIDELQIPIDVALKVTEYLEAEKYLTLVRSRGTSAGGFRPADAGGHGTRPGHRPGCS